MAITVNGGGYGRRRRFQGSISDINVTPFVDVLLVLLVIFMLTAHVMEFGLEIDVPQVRLQKNTTKELPVVSISKDAKVLLNEKEVNLNNLVSEVVKRFGKNQEVYVKADKQTIFDPIAQVLAELGEAKIKVNVVTKPQDVTGRKQ